MYCSLLRDGFVGADGAIPRPAPAASAPGPAARFDLADQIDVSGRAVVPLGVLLELGHAFGQAQALRVSRRTKNSGGQQGRRTDGTKWGLHQRTSTKISE
jgi:hypothetical protein